MPSSTVFVRPLPATATNDRLEEIFSEIGPVKQCFVVTEKGSKTCRGFGYVTYSLVEDAQRALKEVKDYDGRRLFLTMAKQKIRDKKKPAKSEQKEGEDKGEIESEDKGEIKSEDTSEDKSEDKGDKSDKKTVNKATAHLTGNRALWKHKLKARLIIRNLSFKCSEDDLKEVCSKFGTVVEVVIPLKPDGKMRGFAFVMFKTVHQASTALNALNLKEIKGRQVAVDWAVAKHQFVATQASTSPGNKNAGEAKKLKESDSESDEADEDDEKTKMLPQKKRVAAKPAVKPVHQSQSDDEDDSEEEEEDDDDDDDDDDDEEDEDQEEEEADDDDDDDDESSFDSNEDESEDEDEDEKSAKKKAARKPLPSDVQEGRTVFIRNLSFDTEEEGLEEALLKYGEMNYIKVVIHPDTQHSKGCAFVQFKTKEAADKCLAAAQEESETGGIRVDGRKLLIVAAVTKEDATKLKVNKVKVETGTRNLYLAREGLVRAGTKAAEGVSEEDMAKRTRFEDVKRAKLRDQNVFVSKTRLCVHNLPKSVDNQRLKALCLQAVKGEKRVRITECRVMYDRKPLKGQVMGVSLGYGFVQFQVHEHALSTLRYLNNNPKIFTPNKRPIVEFSLEDMRKLKMKELREQKHKEFLKKQPAKGGVKPQAQAAGASQGGKKAQSSSAQAARERVPPQHRKPDGRFSGFQTKPEVEHIDLEDGKKRRKVLSMPSHRGPKIRARDKGKQQAPPPKRGKLGANRKQRQRGQMEKPTQPRNQGAKAPNKQFKRRDGDRFDSLVEQYKKKLMGNTGIKRNKWFDS